MKIWLYLLCATPETSLSASRGLTQSPPVGDKIVTKAAASTLRSSPTILSLNATSNLSTFKAAAASTLRSSPTILPLNATSNLSTFKALTQRPSVGGEIVTKAATSILRSSPTIVPLNATSNLSTSSAPKFETSSRAQELTDNASLMLLIVTIAMLLILSVQLLFINLLRCTLRRHYNQCVEEIKKLVKQVYLPSLESSTDKVGALDNIVITATPNAQSTMVTLALGAGAAVNPPKRSAMKVAIRKLKTLAMGLKEETAVPQALRKKEAGDKGEDMLHSPEAKLKSPEQKLLPSTPVEPTALKRDDHYFSVRKEKPELAPEKSQKQKLPPPAPVVPTPTKDEHYFSVIKEKVEVAVPEQKPQKQKLPPPTPLEPNTPKRDEHYFSVRKEKVEVAVPEQKPQEQKLPPPTPLKPSSQKKEEDFFSLPKAKT